jgi:hypothetical protein
MSTQKVSNPTELLNLPDAAGALGLDLPPVVVPLLMLVREPLPVGGAERKPPVMG